MEKNIQIVVVTIGVLIVVGGIYFCMQKLKQLQVLQVQTQKHLMYQQNILEKHNSILQTLTIGQNANPPTIPIMEPPSMTPPSMTPPPTTETPPAAAPPSTPPPNPMANILPMLSTIMGMMNSDEVDHEEVESAEDIEEVERRKNEMSEEIEKELGELQTDSVPEETVYTKTQEKMEGRVDDETQVVVDQ